MGISRGQVETIGKSFQVKVEKACQTCGYVSPFPNSSSVRISSVYLKARYSDSSFASMLCIEEYDGKKMPKNFKNPVSLFPNFLILLLRTLEKVM
jgi:hypothetical protein